MRTCACSLDHIGPTVHVQMRCFTIDRKEQLLDTYTQRWPAMIQYAVSLARTLECDNGGDDILQNARQNNE